MDSAIIETTGLTRRFGSLTAVDSLDLCAPAGAIYGFLGPNGAGKTTTIRMLLGLIRPDRGSVTLAGHDIHRDRKAALSSVGALVETPAVYPHLTGRDNLAVTARLLGLARGEVDRVLAMVDLTGAADRKAGGYSLGMRQRLGLARALLGTPRLLILDEPTNGLDPAGIRDMRELIRRVPEETGATVFLSSHNLSEIEKTATHLGLMRGGRLIFQGAVDQFNEAIGGGVRLSVDDQAAAAKLFEGHGWEVTLEEGGSLWINRQTEAPRHEEAAVAARLVIEAGLALYSLSAATRSLEEAFLFLTEAGEAE